MLFAFAKRYQQVHQVQRVAAFFLIVLIEMKIEIQPIQHRVIMLCFFHPQAHGVLTKVPK